MGNASDYNIGGIGPNTNSTYGYFQYLVADELQIDNEIHANKITVDNNLLVEGVVKTTNVQIGTFGANSDFTESWNLSDKITELEDRITALEP